ncbi:enterotoxin [Staphylococcus aureus]|nr:enterotoxin [Staphylococcus aureus]CUE91103.1 enterotoxin [Staphylococcus aureus]
MKKLIVIILINIITLSVSNSASAQGDIGIDNLRNFYTKKDFVDLKDVKDNDTPIANQLQFSNVSYDLISESKDFNKFSNFKGKNLMFLVLVIMASVTINTYMVESQLLTNI